MLHTQRPACLKISGKQTPSRLPVSLTHLSNSSIDILLIKKNFTLLSKALGKDLPHVPQNGAPAETRRQFPEP